ncbi:hypothetical protein DICVIV_01922 [Dictyocaulus viviparus]|uniref:Uncharacterized protein n=1 Tax=Dictyocaulus viviparus TaxID=29172 RepID=A0A0D8YBK7_DICVI|nr:hypothetical protein DICVIV_01922 [Dictyocaulus viviparus]
MRHSSSFPLDYVFVLQLLIIESCLKLLYICSSQNMKTTSKTTVKCTVENNGFIIKMQILQE